MAPGRQKEKEKGTGQVYHQPVVFKMCGTRISALATSSFICIWRFLFAIKCYNKKEKAQRQENRQVKDETSGSAGKKRKPSQEPDEVSVLAVTSFPKQRL